MDFGRVGFVTWGSCSEAEVSSIDEKRGATEELGRVGELLAGPVSTRGIRKIEGEGTSLAPAS